jgi:hypothetical protein
MRLISVADPTTPAAFIKRDFSDMITHRSHGEKIEDICENLVKSLDRVSIN